MKGNVLFLATGFEETEALATLDILRRADIEVHTISINDEKYVTGSHGITVQADKIFSQFIKEYNFQDSNNEDIMIFPGGMPGTKNLAGKEELIKIMQKHFSQGGCVAAICAAPGLVASQLDNLEKIKFTCFEGFEAPMINKGCIYTKANTETDRNLITGKGAGLAIEFGLAIVKYIKGEKAEKDVRKGLMLS